MEKVINVTGRGNLKVSPDTIRLSIEINFTLETYNEARELAINCLNNIKTELEKLDIDPKELKTLSFSIRPDYRSYKDEKDDSWKEKFIGYKSSHSLKLEFPINNVLLGKIIYMLNEISIVPKINIDYTIKDQEPIKNKLLAKAVEDSTNKAKIMATAAGVELGEVVNIDYSWKEIDIYNHYNNELSENIYECKGSLDVDFTPDDIDVTDTVTIRWRIK